MIRVGLVHLTPEQLELLSAMTQRPDLEVVAAVHFDAGSTPYKIAQVLAVPTATEVDSLRPLTPDLVVVPEEPAALRESVLALGLAAEVLTTREAAQRYGFKIDIHPGIAAVLSPDDLAPAATPQATPVASPAATPAATPGAAPVADRWPPPADGLAPAGALVPAAAPRIERDPAPDSDLGLAPASEPGPGRGAPQLETMLRDGLDEMLAGEDELAARLHRLAAVWAEFLGADACAIALPPNDRAPGCEWVAAGPSAGQVAGPDTVARLALASGVPQVYVKHDTTHAPAAAAPRRALAAFPLEAVPGVVWFLDLRLPAQEGDERLMILRRTARRLGRLLSLAGLVAQLRRDQAEAQRMADLAARIAAATERTDVVATLREAIASELRPEFAVLRLPGAAEPEVVAALPTALAAEEGALRAAEEDLAQGARAALRSQIKAGLMVADRRVDGLAAPIRRGNECLGTLAVFRSAPASADPAELWSEDERRLLERLGLHAAGALALAGAEAAAPSPGDDILDRRGFAALLRAEVRRSERYAVPFLLTVFELEGADGAAPPDDIIAAFIRRFKSQLRAMDALARLGRARFAVVNPHTDRGGGRMVLRARTVLGQVEKEFPGAALDVRGNQIHFPADVSTFDELIARLG